MRNYVAKNAGAFNRAKVEPDKKNDYNRKNMKHKNHKNMQEYFKWE